MDMKIMFNKACVLNSGRRLYTNRQQHLFLGKRLLCILPLVSVFDRYIKIISNNNKYIENFYNSLTNVFIDKLTDNCP